MALARRSIGRSVSRVLAQHPGESMPCSVFVARTLIEQHRLEDDPAFQETGGSPEGSSWWARANLWAGSPDPVWGCVDAWLELGGREVDLQARPAGAWCVWQAWALDLARPKGHQGLSLRQPWNGRGGVGELLLESDESHGFRDSSLSLPERLAQLRATYGGTWVVRVVAV